MNIYQKKILDLISNGPLQKVSMREIGRLVGIKHPQNVKHHLIQLERKGLANYDPNTQTLSAYTRDSLMSEQGLLSVPIYGAANCGEALKFANDYIEGYLKVSKRLLDRTRDIFILEANGDSMNKAKINDKNIEDGDYVVIDSDYKVPLTGDIIVSIIDGLANIKKFYKDEKNQQIVLLPESTKDYSPIFIGLDEMEKYTICGKVIQVIKKPKI